MRLATVTLTFMAVAAGAAERTLHFAQPAAGLTRVELSVGLGDVKVTGADADQLTATVVVSGKRWQLAELEISARTVGQTLKLALKPAKYSAKKANEDWELALPRELGLAVETGVGDVEVKGMAGELELQVGVGDITVEGFASDLKAEAGVGDVELRGSWSQVGKLRLSTGVGGILVDKPGSRWEGRGMVSETLTKEGPGKAKILVNTGVGDIHLRLQEDPGRL